MKLIFITLILYIHADSKIKSTNALNSKPLYIEFNYNAIWSIGIFNVCI